MNFNDLSDKEKKKYLDGFKQYVAERQGKKVESNEVINSVIDDMYNGTNTREKYFNNNATNNNNDNSIWNKVQNTANNNMTNSNPFNGNDILSRRINGQNKTETQNLLNSTSNNNQTFSEELIKSLASIENIGERTNKIKAFVKDKDEQAKLNLKVNEYIQQQESQEEAQKINSDIQQGNYLSSIGHVLKGIPEEAKNSVIDTVAAIQSIAPAPKTSNTANPERLVDAAKIATNKYQDTTSQIDNGVVQTASNISGTIGQMIPSMLANAMIPGSGNLVQAVNVGSDSYLDNLNENQDNKAQSILTGVLKGTTSYGIEKLTGGNFLSGGSLDDIAKKTIKSKVSSNIGRRIASKIYEIGGETLEENLENQAGYVIDKLVNNKDITREQWLNDLGTTSRDTVLTTIVLNLFGLGGNTYKEIQNDEKVDSNTKDLVKKAEKIIKDENLSVDNVNQTRTVETTNSQNNIDNNENVRTDNIFQQQNQNNIDTSNLNFEDSAKAYNLDTNNETIKTVNQVLSNRDISGRFDASYFNNNNENAIWKTSTDENGNTTREVIFNPNGNTQDTMQQISIHELTHDLAGTKEFDELKNLVLDRNKTMQGYTEARQSLENTYSQVYDPNSKEFKSLVDDEEVADTLAQKLGDQDFVNSLSTEKPTVFKRIYDWVVDKVNKITGNKIEKVYWEDIRNKFENAYRQTYQGESNQTRYSFVGEKGLNNAIMQEPGTYMTVEQGLNRAKQMQKTGTDNENIRQNTGWFQDRNGDWKFEISDKNMKIKDNIQLKENTNYKLGDIIEHNTLFTMYPNFKNIDINFKDLKNVNGFYDKKQKSITINNKIINSGINLEKTIIHELQHSIQNEEGFENGTTSRLSRKRYYENLGEIEASDTAQRFLKEKYENSSNSTAPESSKANPKHKNYDRYMQKRGVVDKIKDNMFKSSKKGDKSYETFEENISENQIKDKNLVAGRERGRYLNEIESKPSISENNKWQDFLNTQIGQRGKGKTVQELKLPTKENLEIIQSKKKIENINKDKLKKIGITEEKDIITDKKENENKTEEEKVAEILTEIPTKEKEKSRIWAIFKANVLDKGIVFEELSRKTKNRELQGKWDYTLTANARGQNAIGMPRYELDSKTKSQKQISKSLESIREEVGENKEDFSNYMYHQLNIDRMTLEERFDGDTGINYERKNPIKNKPVFADKITAEISQEIVNKYEQTNPKFKEWAKDVYDFLDANTKELVKSGVISEDTRQLFKEMYPHYVPIARVNSKGNTISVPLDTGRTGINSPIKRAKGGNQDILPLFETIADRTLQTYRASARNNFGVELLNTLKTVQEVENVDMESIIEDISNTENNTELLKKGDKTTPPSFTVFDNGEKVTFEISKDMYDALKPVSEGLAYRNKVLNKISNFRRGVLTEYNPVFMITNSIKDIQDIVINSQHTAKTILKMPEAYVQIIRKGYWYNEYLQNGGEQNSYFNANDGSFENDKKVSLVKNVATLPLRGISKVNNIIEMSPRLAEYIASREKGKSIETSMLDAARVTTNFKAGGNITKLLNRNGGTFLNASVQGAMQQVRNIQEAKVKGLKGWTVLACKYAIAGLPTILLNNILWDDDEDYNNLQDYVKDNYYCIAKYGDGKFIRIPKGRTVATIQKVVSNVNKYVTKDEKLNIDNLAKDFWEDLQFAMDNLAPNNPIDNNVISPIIQAVTNTSWYGEDIVPSRLQDKPVTEQYDETTDKFSKWLGEKLNVSPYKINYLLDQYGGGISDIVLPMLTPQAENNMVEDKFTTDSVMKSKYPGEFFEKSDELNVKANSDKATDIDKIKSKYLSQVSEEMNKLYKEKREIQNSAVDDELKKKQLKDVQKNINKLAEEGIKEVDKAKVSGITANVGNELYYKYHGEWTKLSDEEKEKGLDKILDSYADYKNKVYEVTEQKKATGEIEGESQLKEKEKLSILINEKYAKDDKQKIYESTIGNDDDFYTNVLKESNIDINEYLKYKQQKFESDKKDDGTLEGKTITNSKKQKVYNYVNNMNVNYNQKLLILGKQYKLSDSEQKKLYQYINSIPGQTSKEKLEIFKMYTNNFQIYKNGTMSFK